ncbi:family 10 glycoside hydrolase [Melampsora larici-populina 98AG31]|uniref:Beta-xylanase n=1 Tax=Melampsora larici-populina (strain 98AG31 / pathotype 3-4-7) TaxID=747676 RepID=F4S1S2_MELLP|nr:family 10 glycoside hydrolase [Melampsora larici-populina 98AG31]EGG01456.1 family 10 glycoside hydrolase [Melampsora larici-populina 98AG31]
MLLSFFVLLDILSILNIGVICAPEGQPKSITSPRRPHLGTAVDNQLLKTNPEYARTIQKYFKVLTPENAMKWDATEKTQGKFTFEGADEIVQFALQHHKIVRGHTVVWHRQVPQWVMNLDSEALIKATQNHITALMKHFEGKMFALDVCNEILGEDGTFRDSFWYQKLKETFPEMALKAARQASPGVKLYINDYSIEGINKKSDGLYNLAKGLKAKGLLDGVGFQTHLIVGQVPKDMKQNLERFAALGLDVAISELDIRMPVPASKENLEQQAKDYQEVVQNCRSVTRCYSVTVWGVAQSESWIPKEFPGMGSGLLFDDNFKPTTAFQGVSSIIKSSG